jgi:hypothetical protein
VPHRTVKSGTERTTTVAGNLSLTWHLALCSLNASRETWLGAGSGSIWRGARLSNAMAAVIAPSAARTNITQNAAWNAFATASPRAAGSASPAISPARETGTVDTAATPTAPPISRMVRRARTPDRSSNA